MENVSKYQRWEITGRGACISRSDEEFGGAIEIPSFLDVVPVVEIGEKAF